MTIGIWVLGDQLGTGQAALSSCVGQQVASAARLNFLTALFWAVCCYCYKTAWLFWRSSLMLGR